MGRFENSAQGAEGECDLRALDRKRAPRMLGFHDSDKRDSHSPNAPMLGGPLQSRPPAFQSWTRDTGSEFTQGRVASAAPLYSKGLPSRRDIYSWRATSRVPAAENCRMRIQNARMFFSGRQARLAHLQKWQITEQFTGSVFSTCGPAFPIFIG